MTKDKVVNIHTEHRKRMRNRFLNEGFKTFQDHEILEALLFLVIPFKNTNPIAHKLIDKFGSFSDVLDAEVSQLMQVDGVTEIGAINIKMIGAMAQAYKSSVTKRQTSIVTRFDVINYLVPLLETTTKETMIVVCLDSSYKIISRHIWEGSINKVNVPIRDIVSFCMEKSAIGVIIGHSHPRGEPKPSHEDDVYTKSLLNAFMALDMTLMEHLVVAGELFYSYLDNGKLGKFTEEYLVEFKPASLRQKIGGLSLE